MEYGEVSVFYDADNFKGEAKWKQQIVLRKKYRGEMRFREKVSWSMVGAGTNLLGYFLTGYMTYFFTDVMLIPAVSLVAVMLIARALNIVQDIGIGVVVDRTRRKNGQCRPFYKWFVIPYLAACVLFFLNPELKRRR